MVHFGVPQGSVLGPILFLLYTADVLQLINRHHLHPHVYTDDTQIYGSCNPADVDILRERVSVRVDDLSAWMRANRLQLNPTKTEVLWCSSARRQHQIPTTPVHIGNMHVLPVSSVGDLGSISTPDLTMTAHVAATVRTCFVALRQICSVRRSLTKDALLMLLRALVVSKVDCYSTVLAGVSLSLTDRLQSVLNAAARLVFSARRSEHVTALLRDLHWLKVLESSSSLCSDTPLSTWHCAAVPYRDNTTDLWHVCTSSSLVCRNADSGRPFDPSFNTWRLSISCGCRTRLELSAVLAASSPVTDDVQASLESRTVHLGLTVFT